MYKLNRIEFFCDVFIWAFTRSAARYVAVKYPVGEAELIRMRDRVALDEVVGVMFRTLLPALRGNLGVDRQLLAIFTLSVGAIALLYGAGLHLRRGQLPPEPVGRLFSLKNEPNLTGFLRCSEGIGRKEIVALLRRPTYRLSKLLRENVAHA